MLPFRDSFFVVWILTFLRNLDVDFERAWQFSVIHIRGSLFRIEKLRGEAGRAPPSNMEWAMQGTSQ